MHTIKLLDLVRGLPNLSFKIDELSRVPKAKKPNVHSNKKSL